MCYNILNIIQAGKSMTLQQLKYIVTVAQTGTITEAGIYTFPSLALLMQFMNLKKK